MTDGAFMPVRKLGHAFPVGDTLMATAKVRLVLLMLLISIGFGALMVRTLDLGLSTPLKKPLQTQRVDYRGLLNPTTRASRADIVDRNGEILATSLETASLAVNPHKIKNPRILARKLADIIPSVSVAKFEADLSSGRPFVWLHRNLTPGQKWKVNAIGEPALEFHKSQERLYPHGTLAAHILGQTNTDGLGQSGLERYFNDRLSDPARVSEPVSLSIDVRVQYALADELAAMMRAHKAVGASGLVMDVNTGELLAAASLPDFDPNVSHEPEDKRLFNRVSLGTYELGSILKTFTLAAALDDDVISMNDGYDATRPLRVGRFTIHDDHPKKRYLTVPEIYTHSSNIGMALMAEDLGQERQKLFLDKIGLLSRPRIELMEVGESQVPQNWNRVETMTISYGHGIAVSPLQLATGIASMVNGGRLIPATLIRKSERVSDGVQVISGKTSRQIRQLMRLAVTKGTGGKADAPGYRVGGKTGSAEKATAGGYRRRSVISSFVGVFPMDDPRYLVFASLDEPQGNESTHNFRSAGWTAAPIVGNVIMRVSPLLGIEPRREDEGLYEKVALLIEDDD